MNHLTRSKVNEQPWRLTSFPVNHSAEIKSQSDSGSPVTTALPDTNMSPQNYRSHSLPQFASNTPQEQ